MFHYKKIESDLNFEGKSSPANNNDIDTFEENNTSISTNVYETDDNEQIVISRKYKNKTEPTNPNAHHFAQTQQNN